MSNLTDAPIKYLFEDRLTAVPLLMVSSLSSHGRSIFGKYLLVLGTISYMNPVIIEIYFSIFCFSFLFGFYFILSLFGIEIEIER